MIVNQAVVRVVILAVSLVVKRICRPIMIRLGVKTEKTTMKRNILFSLFALKSDVKRKVSYAVRNVLAQDPMKDMKLFVLRLLANRYKLQ